MSPPWVGKPNPLVMKGSKTTDITIHFVGIIAECSLIWLPTNPTYMFNDNDELKPYLPTNILRVAVKLPAVNVQK